MDYKKQIESLLNSLKSLGISRADIEKDLDYSPNYIDQQLSKGGNKKFLKRLQDYRIQVLQKARVHLEEVREKEADYGSLTLLIEQQNKLILSMNKQSETANAILERMANNVEKRVEGIDANLIDALGRVDSLKLDLYSGRLVMLQSLARLEKKSENALLTEADSIVASLLTRQTEQPGKRTVKSRRYK